MIDKSKCVIIIFAATLIVALPAFAQHPIRSGGFYAATTVPRSPVFVDRNDPAIAGGGSLGYNRRVEQGF